VNTNSETIINRRPTFKVGGKVRGMVGGIVWIPILILFCVLPVHANPKVNSVVCRPDLPATHRHELVERLREITGWRDLDFDEHGALHSGGAHTGGSAMARELLAAAISGEQFLILEDASGRSDVAFCRVVEGRWIKDEASKPPAHIVLIDFADFTRVTGDRDALAAFNVGWGVLHEISHVVHDSLDPKHPGEVGDCEHLINRMRRECDLAERAEYFFTFYPGAERSEFKTRYVRLAFKQPRSTTGKQRRLWLMWDATAVGGL